MLLYKAVRFADDRALRRFAAVVGRFSVAVLMAVRY